MASRGGTNAVRAAAADLDLVERAADAERQAKAHTMQVVQEVLDRQPRLLTVDQVAAVLGITSRALNKRLNALR